MMRRLLAFGLSLTILLIAGRPLVGQAPAATAAQEPATPTAWEATPLTDWGHTLDFFGHSAGPLFLRSPGQLLRSDDDATTWRDVPLPPQAPTWRNIASPGDPVVVDPHNPDVIYANGAAGVSRTTDGGLSWTVAFPLAGEGPTRQLAISPSDSNVMYREVRTANDPPESSLARSYDGGVTWETVPPQPEAVTCAYLSKLQVHPTDPHRLFGGHRCSTRGGQVWHSRDGGATWAVLFALDDPLIPTVGSLRLAVGTGATPAPLYVSASYNLGPATRPTGTASAVFRSDDDGATWQRRATFAPRPDDPERTSIRIVDLAVDPTLPDRLYIALDADVWQRTAESFQRSGVHASMDGGATWTDLADPRDVESGRVGRLAIGVGGGQRYLFAAKRLIWRLPVAGP